VARDPVSVNEPLPGAGDAIGFAGGHVGRGVGVAAATVVVVAVARLVVVPIGVAVAVSEAEADCDPEGIARELAGAALRPAGVALGVGTEHPTSARTARPTRTPLNCLEAGWSTTLSPSSAGEYAIGASHFDFRARALVTRDPAMG
jgi:hypothetical protein